MDTRANLLHLTMDLSTMDLKYLVFTLIDEWLDSLN